MFYTTAYKTELPLNAFSGCTELYLKKRRPTKAFSCDLTERLIKSMRGFVFNVMPHIAIFLEMFLKCLKLSLKLVKALDYYFGW